MREKRVVPFVAVVLAALLASTCSSYRSMPVEEKRTFLAELESSTLVDLVELHPEAEAELESSRRPRSRS
jgi:hypothetical protein